MRHLVSIVVAPVLGLIMYVLLGLSFTRLRDAGDGWDGDTVILFLAAVGAGLAFAALLLPRLSPLGPALVGLVLLGLTLWLFSDVSSFLDTMPTDLLGIDGGGIAPVGPITAMLSIPLLATLASARRWRRTPYPNRPVASPQGYPPAGGPPAGYGTPQQPGYGAPQPAYGAPPVGVGSPVGYPGNPPIGAPYSGPPAYDPTPPAYDPAPPPAYGAPPSAGGYPPDPMNPDITRRI